MAKPDNKDMHKASLRRTGREEYVQAMRSGVRFRAATFEDGKAYKRKPKHRKEWR